MFWPVQEDPIPQRTEYVDDGRGLLRIWSGVVTGPELAAAAASLMQDEDRSRRIEYAIIDLTEVTELLVTTEEIRRLTDINVRVSSVTSGSVVAVVAAQDFVFGLARMWQVLAEKTGWRIRVFRSRVDAHQWIEQVLHGSAA